MYIVKERKQLENATLTLENNFDNYYMKNIYAIVINNDKTIFTEDCYDSHYDYEYAMSRWNNEEWLLKEIEAYQKETFKDLPIL